MVVERLDSDQPSEERGCTRAATAPSGGAEDQVREHPDGDDEDDQRDPRRHLVAIDVVEIVGRPLWPGSPRLTFCSIHSK